MKLYTVVVHYLQMYMKEWNMVAVQNLKGEIIQLYLTATIFLHAHLQVVFYNCVKFHKNSISRLGGVALTRYMPPAFS
jgi:hypothetical protein